MRKYLLGFILEKGLQAEVREAVPQLADLMAQSHKPLMWMEKEGMKIKELGLLQVLLATDRSPQFHQRRPAIWCGLGDPLSGNQTQEGLLGLANSLLLCMSQLDASQNVVRLILEARYPADTFRTTIACASEALEER